MCYISHFAHFKSSSVQQTAKALFSYLFEIHVFLFSPHSHNQLLPAQKYLSINKCSGHKLICTWHNKFQKSAHTWTSKVPDQPFLSGHHICLQSLQSNLFKEKHNGSKCSYFYKHCTNMQHVAAATDIDALAQTCTHPYTFFRTYFSASPTREEIFILCGHPTSQIARPTLSLLLSFKILGS